MKFVIGLLITLFTFQIFAMDEVVFKLVNSADLYHKGSEHCTSMTVFFSKRYRGFCERETDKLKKYKCTGIIDDMEYELSMVKGMCNIERSKLNATNSVRIYVPNNFMARGLSKPYRNKRYSYNAVGDPKDHRPFMFANEMKEFHKVSKHYLVITIIKE